MTARKTTAKPKADTKDAAPAQAQAEPKPTAPDPETGSSLTVVLMTVGRRTVLRGQPGERVFLNGPNEVPDDEVTEELLEALEADGSFTFKPPKPD